MERQIGAAAPRWVFWAEVVGLGLLLVVLVWEVIDLREGKAVIREALGTAAMCVSVACSLSASLATGRRRLRNALVAASILFLGAAAPLMLAK